MSWILVRRTTKKKYANRTRSSMLVNHGEICMSAREGEKEKKPR